MNRRAVHHQLTMDNGELTIKGQGQRKNTCPLVEISLIFSLFYDEITIACASPIFSESRLFSHISSVHEVCNGSLDSAAR